MTDGDAQLGVSPYASGSGGTVLEHLYGAVLLPSLLAGDLAVTQDPQAAIDRYNDAIER